MRLGNSAEAGTQFGWTRLEEMLCHLSLALMPHDGQIQIRAHA